MVLNTSTLKTDTLFVAIFQASSEGILVFNTLGAIVLANPAAVHILGYADEQAILNQSIDILLPAELTEQHRHHFQRYLQNPTARPMGIGLDNLLVKQQNGAMIPVEISLSPIQQDGQLYIMALIMDVSRRKQLEEERVNNELMRIELLRQQERIAMREQMTRYASHELRSPLTTILLSASALERQATEMHEKQAAYLIC